MEVRISPEVQAKFDRIARQQGRDAESLAREAVERLVDYDEWFAREIEKGLAEIESNQTLSHDRVGALLEKAISERQKRS